MLAAYMRRVGARRALIVADADEAGLRGSEPRRLFSRR